ICVIVQAGGVAIAVHRDGLACSEAGSGHRQVNPGKADLVETEYTFHLLQNVVGAVIGPVGDLGVIAPAVNGHDGGLLSDIGILEAEIPVALVVPDVDVPKVQVKFAGRVIGPVAQAGAADGQPDGGEGRAEAAAEGLLIV